MESAMFASVLSAIPPWISDYIVWWAAAVIVVGGLLVFGWDDLPRVRWRRIWAISSVNFAESIRRRVLWVTPLAILGVIAVGQLQHALDEQEAIRQTAKYCLFASGLLVTITAIILACTNLPREIESRVIFTVVTKPTTRLEIVLGKVLGFVRISGLIVVIMGLFTFCYIEVRTWQLQRTVARRLQTESDASTLSTLEGYQQAGLLSTKSLEQARNLQIYDRLPTDEHVHWIHGGEGYFFDVPFDLTAQDRALFNAATEDPPRAQVLVINTMRLKRSEPTTKQSEEIRNRRLPLEGGNALGPAAPNAGTPKPVPQISVRILNQNLSPIIPGNQINGGKPIDVPLDHQNPNGTYSIPLPLSPEVVRQLLDVERIYIRVVPETPAVEYEVTDVPTVIDAFDAANRTEHVIKPAPSDDDKTRPSPPIFTTQTNRYGLQVAGSSKGEGSVAIYAFRNADVPKETGGNVDFRFRAGIDRGGDYDPSKPYSTVTLEVVNRRTGESSGPIDIHPETNRDLRVSAPAKFVAGGNFDVLIRGTSDGQWIGITKNSLQLVSSEHSFVVNLVKSLLILWLLSILVVIIAVFTSTFLSWPIAVVLTLLILLGHWGVEQLGDTLNPGVGRSVATDFGFREAAPTRVVSASVDALAKMLTTLSKILPDVSKFPVIDDISRGVSIPPRSIVDSLGVLACYGLPMLVLSFVIFKNKEVAP
jgi:ABC-type transport system involved in multi-copper enzyme maturation permease subunit